MKKMRRVLASVVLAGLSLGAGAAIVSSGHGSDDEQAGCRWVRRIGLVCDTELSTINI
ncbi:MAG: hypothetical protein ABWZ15_18630 [Acidimicrobiia bacterium]